MIAQRVANWIVHAVVGTVTVVLSITIIVAILPFVILADYAGRFYAWADHGGT